MNWFSLFISFIALLISGFTLWHSFLLPFTLNISASFPYWNRNNPTIEKGKNIFYQTKFIMTISFSNAGAKAGFVDDVIVRFKSNGFHIDFIPSVNINMENFNQVIMKGRPDIEYIEAPFHPIYINGNGQAEQSIMFIPYLEDEKKNIDIPYGEYEVSILTRVSHRISWFNIPFFRHSGRKKIWDEKLLYRYNVNEALFKKMGTVQALIRNSVDIDDGRRHLPK